MTGFWPGLVCFGIAVCAMWSDDFTRRLSAPTGRAICAICFFGSLACIGLGGFHALTDWGFIDLVGEASNRGIGVSGREGIVLTLISLWPLVMIAVGFFGALIAGRSYRAAAAR